jgi:hypothetical protein
MFGVDKEFFQNCACELVSIKTVQAAIGTGIAQALFFAGGLVSARTAAVAGIMYVAGHVVARGQARYDGSSGPGGMS